jgi:hypothetical protein
VLSLVSTSRILATDLSHTHCNYSTCRVFNSHTKSSGHSLIPFTLRRSTPWTPIYDFLNSDSVLEKSLFDTFHLLLTAQYTGNIPTSSQVKSSQVALRLTVSQSVSLIWGSWPDIYYCLTVTVLLLCCALSDERTSLSFVRVTVSSNKSFVIMWRVFTFYMLNMLINVYKIHMYRTSVSPGWVQPSMPYV